MMSNTSPQIGRFTIIKALGRGSQGAVYLARDPDLDRLVAVKLVSEMAGQSAEDADGWPQARNLAQLRHPNIIALHELGRFHNLTYLVFEYLEGTPLRDEVNAMGIMPPPLAYSTMAQVIDAMAYAHAKGILHLDLNPNNVMRDEEGKPRIMDFDLSRHVDLQPNSRLITGTLPYMAPEHFKSRKLDKRTDVYALGQILFELLSGELAVPLDKESKMISDILERDADFDLLRTADPGGHFTQVIRQATLKDPDSRYPHARALYDALNAAWEKARPKMDAKEAIVHGTVAFVMKRIERKGDFPAVSKTLAEVNQLTSDNSQSPISRLSAVVLRDYALTNRLLKLANSSYYARSTGNVKSVSDAINLLGIEQVRLTCNGLTCFGHFAGRKQDARLREESICAFIAGLLARHLATQAGVKESESAFLAGMLHHLGRMLALYYFPDDYEEIEDLISRGATPEEAARSVLGIGLAEMGHAVGELWGLPPMALACMRDQEDEFEVLRLIVRFANTLVAADTQSIAIAEQLEADTEVLRTHLNLDAAKRHALLEAGLEKFRSFAPALELDLAKSPAIQRIESWLEDTAAKLAQCNDASTAA